MQSHFWSGQWGPLQAAYVCLAINNSGIREVLGIYIGESESSKFWLSVLTGATGRIMETAKRR